MSNPSFTRRGLMGGVAAATGVTIAVDASKLAHSDDAVTLLGHFRNLTEQATGVPKDEVEATGQATLYFAVAKDALGKNLFTSVLQTYGADGLEATLASPKFGPIVRNLIKLWYTATWERLPDDWRASYGFIPNDTTFIVSATAYTTGLLWATIGSNPPGANAPGYATWSNPPSRTP